MKVYVGDDEGSVRVTEGERRYDLDPRHDLRNHSPDGFAWGYEGSGPAQLALALLCDLLDDDEHALRRYQQFKSRFVARLEFDRPWEVDEASLRAALRECEV